MRPSVLGAMTLTLLLLTCCSTRNDDSAMPSKAAIESAYTVLGVAACKQEIDREDPNQTHYLICPGVEGYTLIVRHVDAGRQSIDVVDSAQRAFPLNLQEYVTRHMFSLDDKAEWRVATRGGKRVPIALIVRVQAREDNDNPEKVTRIYRAIAKISPNEACITDRLIEGAQSEADVRREADKAQERPCAPPQPPMRVGGAVIR